MELLHREFEIRQVDQESKEVTGVAVPYNEVTQVGRMKEKFAPNSVTVNKLPKLFYNHDEPIGIIRSLDDKEDGLHITAKISDTSKGQDAWTLVKDGVVRSFSVGFVPIEHTLDGDVVVRQKVDLKEVSLVALPAYEGAVITQIRSDAPEQTNLGEINTMENTNTETVDLNPAIDDLNRRVAVLETTKTTAVATPSIRTYGEYIKGLVTGSEEAQSMYRALTTVSDIAGLTSQQNFVRDIKGVVDTGRPAVAAFSTSDLPTSGMTVFFPKVNAQGASSGVQAAEGDELTNTEFTVSQGSATIKTIGGYNQVSRQVVERSDPAYLDALFRMQAIGYAKKTDQECIAVLTANDANFGNASVAAGTAAAWLTATADLSAHIYSAGGLTANFILVSKDVFKDLAGLIDGVDRPLFAALNPQNNIGNADLPRLQGNLFGLPVIVDVNLADDKAYLCSREAITNYESAGAPFRISQDTVTALTQDFAVYGYMATAMNNVNGIGKYDF
jgi:HK97 family phage prohead protease